jgi:hypothetical protein
MSPEETPLAFGRFLSALLLTGLVAAVAVCGLFSGTGFTAVGCFGRAPEIRDHFLKGGLRLLSSSLLFLAVAIFLAYVLVPGPVRPKGAPESWFTVFCRWLATATAYVAMFLSGHGAFDLLLGCLHADRALRLGQPAVPFLEHEDQGHRRNDRDESKIGK